MDDEASELAPAAAGPVFDLTPPAPTVQDIAQRAVAMEHRMETLAADIDPSWTQDFMARTPVLSLLPEHDGSRLAAFNGVLGRFCGTVPSLDRLATEAAHIATQRRPVVLRALCLLALSRRPGVLRCCVDRSQRELLTQNLGDALGAVEALSASGRPVSHEATGWTPLHWSCLGYLDWLAMLAREDTFLRRLVRLLLPRGLLDMPQRVHHARADLAPGDAVARLQAAGVRWPC